MRLLAAWREVAARSSGLAPSETLALAERADRAVRSQRGLSATLDLPVAYPWWA